MGVCLLLARKLGLLGRLGGFRGLLGSMRRLRD